DSEREQAGGEEKPRESLRRAIEQRARDDGRCRGEADAVVERRLPGRVPREQEVDADGRKAGYEIEQPRAAKRAHHPAFGLTVLKPYFVSEPATVVAPLVFPAPSVAVTE